MCMGVAAPARPSAQAHRGAAGEMRGAEVGGKARAGDRSLGTRVGSRTLGELMGSMASAESVGAQGPHACENWRC